MVTSDIRLPQFEERCGRWSSSDLGKWQVSQLNRLFAESFHVAMGVGQSVPATGAQQVRDGLHTELGVANAGLQVQVQVGRGVAIGEVVRAHDVRDFGLQQDVQRQAIEVAIRHRAAESYGPDHQIGPLVAHSGH